jgi:hypothetical protein
MQEQSGTIQGVIGVLLFEAGLNSSNLVSYILIVIHFPVCFLGPLHRTKERCLLTKHTTVLIFLVLI